MERAWLSFVLSRAGIIGVALQHCCTGVIAAPTLVLVKAHVVLLMRETINKHTHGVTELVPLFAPVPD